MGYDNRGLSTGGRWLPERAPWTFWPDRDAIAASLSLGEPHPLKEMERAENVRGHTCTHWGVPMLTGVQCYNLEFSELKMNYTLFFFYKNLAYKNIEAEICDLLIFSLCMYLSIVNISGHE